MARIRGVSAVLVVAFMAATLSGSGRADVGLALSIDVPGIIPQGTDFTATFRVTNNGTTQATDVHLTVQMPPSSVVSNLSVPSSCSPAGPDGSVQCYAATLDAGATWTVAFGGRAATIGNAYINATAISGGASAPANANSSIGPPPANVTIDESISPQSIAPGGSGTVTVSVANTGSDRASFWVTLDLGPGPWSLSPGVQTSGPAFSCSTTQYHMECSVATFPGGASAAFAVPLTLAATATPGQILDSRAGSYVDMPSGAVLAGASRSLQVAQPAGGDTTPTTTTTTTTAPPPPPPSQPTLTVTLRGSGSGTVTSAPTGIACGPSCSARFPAGTSVTLTATPAAGSVFDNWGDHCPLAGSRPTCSFTVGQDTAVTVWFELAPSTTTPAPPPPPPQPGSRCHVPALRGLALAPARHRLDANGCTLGSARSVRNAHVTRGHIVGQTPRPGSVLPHGGRVAVTLSKGR